MFLISTLSSLPIHRVIMGLSSSAGFHKHNRSTHLYLCFSMLVFLSCVTEKANLISNQSFFSITVPHENQYHILSSFQRLGLDGYISFQDRDHAAKDFGNMHHYLPLAVLHPKTVSDISSTIKYIFEAGSASKLTVAARGHGHSLHGQSQAQGGLVINMESLKEPGIQVHVGDTPYVDASGGELWINILHETLRYGLSPKSWTDYLYLTVGGTLSNAGISGQAFRHGAQINNIYQLEVVTGKGEVFVCSEKQNAELFYSVLGGLGQFGIITRARISLEPARERVKWIRVLYSEFDIFTRDQEYLISLENSFDYIEGFVIINRTGILNRWRSSFDAKDPLQASKFSSDGKTLYCLEVAKYFNSAESEILNQITEELLSKLSYIPSTLLLSEVSYLEFLDRVHFSEIKLRSQGLWEVPHPWLNLLVPKGKIQDFARGVFGTIITDSSNGPILIYPMNQSKWNNRTSLVTPNDDIFYVVALLSSVVPGSTEKDSLEHIFTQNKRILEFIKANDHGVKQYLPHHTTKEEWQAHFSSRWHVFVERKLTYDPLAILNPGQKIFRRTTSDSSTGNLTHQWH